MMFAIKVWIIFNWLLMPFAVSSIEKKFDRMIVTLMATLAFSATVYMTLC